MIMIMVINVVVIAVTIIVSYIRRFYLTVSIVDGTFSMSVVGLCLVGGIVIM